MGLLFWSKVHLSSDLLLLLCLGVGKCTPNVTPPFRKLLKNICHSVTFWVLMI